MAANPPAPEQEPAAAIEARRARLRDDLRQCGVLDKYLDVDLDALPPGLPPGYHALARRLKALIAEPGMLAVVGPTGRGKTALAAGLCRMFIERGRYARLRTATSYLDAWASASGERRQRVRLYAERVDLLVLDEVQDRPRAEWLESQFYDLMIAREGRRLATVLITNLQSDMLLNHIGDRLHRRISDEGGVHEARWPLVKQLLSAQRN